MQSTYRRIRISTWNVSKTEAQHQFSFSVLGNSARGQVRPIDSICENVTGVEKAKPPRNGAFYLSVFLLCDHRRARYRISKRVIVGKQQNRLYRIDKEKQITDDQFGFGRQGIDLDVYDAQAQYALGNAAPFENDIAENKDRGIR